MPAVPSTPASRRTDTQTMPTPQTHSTVPPSSSPPQTSSPQKSSSDHTAKLKHPTRLHSKDLTANTFRIYVKHYMDSLCRKQLSRAVSRNSSQEDVFLDDTSPNRTPRASKRSESGKKPILQGISLSHLRRVDDLRVLARRVVAAEGKRRERDVKQKEKEARRKEREGASQRGTAVRLSPKQASKLTPTTLKPIASTEPTSAKVKRLFLWTVRKLLEDGGIIVCEGPGLPLPRSTDMNERSLSCWKDVTNTTINSVSLDTSTLSKSSLISIQSSVGKDPEDDWPSDPDSDYQEECYLPLSNEVLAQPLLDAIAIIVRPGSGLRGATISEMMTRLKRDDRWKQVGEWHIQDALEYLDEVDKVWKVSGDRWGLVRC
ncbi:hypothetical protein FRC02_012046 [Tulasnella sp. 418]|nr:hypothetical protein FRC02_012046 [Tulasnella sp. 418]